MNHNHNKSHTDDPHGHPESSLSAPRHLYLVQAINPTDRVEVVSARPRHQGGCHRHPTPEREASCFRQSGSRRHITRDRLIDQVQFAYKRGCKRKTFYKRSPRKVVQVGIPNRAIGVESGVPNSCGSHDDGRPTRRKKHNCGSLNRSARVRGYHDAVVNRCRLPCVVAMGKDCRKHSRDGGAGRGPSFFHGSVHGIISAGGNSDARANGQKKPVTQPGIKIIAYLIRIEVAFLIRVTVATFLDGIRRH
mmetsp:Transcript_32420/g.74639  ORF Transcript_32420/g.74639 Transcript_32420/m.74639 type:complete len:248 (+) Transcript_32420:437-1180(+)